MQRKTLEFQADQIELVLARHKVPGRVSGGLVSPRWVKFDVLPALGARISKIKGLAEELAPPAPRRGCGAGVALGADTCRVARQGARLAVEVPRADPRPVRLLPLQRRLAGEMPSLTAILGIAEDGAPLLVRLPSPDVIVTEGGAHVLVSGTTGSGKTALARSLIVSLALGHRRSQLGFVLIDPKGRAFDPLRGLPHLLRPVLREPDEAGRALADLVEVMLRRDQDACSVPSAALGDADAKPKVVVVIDELADLLMSTGQETAEALTRLAQRGREAGLHLVACTQKPTSKVVGSLAKANFPVRLVGRVTSAQDALCAAGVGGTGAERLSGRGDFLVVSGPRTIRFQAAYVSEGEIRDAVG